MSWPFVSCVFDIPDEALAGPLDSMGPMVRAAATMRPRPHVVIEVFNVDTQPVVLVSLAKPPSADAPPKALGCFYAFASVIATCDYLRRRGFPAIEAKVSRDSHGDVEINCAYYPAGDGDVAPEWGLFLTLRNVPPDPKRPRNEPAMGEAVYVQQLQSPDPGHASRRVCIANRRWLTKRRFQFLPQGKARLEVKPEKSRFPDFGQLVDGAETVSMWKGELYRMTTQRSPGPAVRTGDRSDIFGPPSFRFEDVQIIGFRIDLPHDAAIDAALQGLVEPLNFHLDPPVGAAQPDFRYRVATRSLVVELLRYGRMKSNRPVGPLRAGDYMSQHELLVRVLVGRLDDGASQARDPAVHAPALFVDNPWSKAVGLQFQGYPKRLASFCCERDGRLHTLSMDGCVVGEKEPVPLHEVSRLRLLQSVDDAGWIDADADTSPQALDKDTLMEVHLPPGQPDGKRDFRSVNLGWLGAAPALWGMPWRQSDFDAVEYRRSFANEVMASRFAEFESIQVSPVHDESPLPKAWVNGRFTLRDPTFAPTVGVAKLRFRHPPNCGQGWDALLALLEKGRLLTEDGTLSVLSGDWYRVRCNIDLEIDDGLYW